MYVHVGLCVHVWESEDNLWCLSCLASFLLLLYHRGQQASGDSPVSASHLLHISAGITDVCYCTQLLHGSGHLKSGPHECMARTLYPLSHLQLSKTVLIIYFLLIINEVLFQSIKLTNCFKCHFIARWYN